MHNGAQQLDFDFGVRPPDARRRADSLFFAALPEADAAHRIAAVAGTLRKANGLTGPLRPTRLLHVSLAGVHDFSRLPDPVVTAASQAGAMIRKAPFEVHFSYAMSFDGHRRPGHRRAIVLRCDRGAREFGELRGMIGAAMRSIRVRCGQPKSFVPHVTMLYDEASLPETALPEPITWTVRELVLVHSLVGRGQHIHLARWQLG